MLDFFTAQRPLTVEPISFMGDTVTFATSQRLERGRPLEVRDQNGQRATVEILNRRRSITRRWLYFAQLLEGELLAGPQPSEPHRRFARLEVGLRVRSPQLPGFVALTSDLSEYGTQLLTEGPLAVGEQLELVLDLDADHPELSLTGTVCWSRMTAPTRVGVRFDGLDAQQKRRLADYLTERADPNQARVRISGEEEVLTPKDDPACLKTSAWVEDGFQDESGLTLRVTTDEKLMEFHFPNPNVTVADLSRREVADICTENLGDNRVRYSFADTQGATILELESHYPEITVSSATD